MNSQQDKIKLIKLMKSTIDLTLMKSYMFDVLKNPTPRVNYLKKLGQKYGIEDITIDAPKTYEMLANYLNNKIKNNKMNESKSFINNIILESQFNIPATTSIIRYDDDIAVKVIKDIIENKFKNYKLLQVNANEGGAFYTAIVSTKLEDAVKNDLERNRYFLNSAISNFKLAFTHEISNLLPVINVTTGSFQANKNNSALNFSITILLSHTNDREWVSGNYKKIDETGVEKIIEENLTEAASGRKSMVDPMPLETAIRKYKSKEINLEVLETAIKACGRAELEIFVLKNIGVKVTTPSTNQEEKSIEETEMNNLNF